MTNGLIFCIKIFFATPFENKILKSSACGFQGTEHTDTHGSHQVT